MSVEISAFKSPAPHRPRPGSIRILEQQASCTDNDAGADSPYSAGNNAGPYQEDILAKGIENIYLQTPEPRFQKRGSSVYSTDDKPLPTIKFREPLVSIDFNTDTGNQVGKYVTMPSPLRDTKSYPDLSEGGADHGTVNSARSSLEDQHEDYQTLQKTKTVTGPPARRVNSVTPMSRRHSLSLRLKRLSKRSLSSVRLHSKYDAATPQPTPPPTVRDPSSDPEPEQELRTLAPMPHSLTEDELQYERQVLARALTQSESSGSWARRAARRMFSSTNKELETEADRIFGPTEDDHTASLYSHVAHVPSHHRNFSDRSDKRMLYFPIVPAEYDFVETGSKDSGGHEFLFDPFKEFGSVQAELQNNIPGSQPIDLNADMIRKIYLRLLLEHSGPIWVRYLRQLRRMSLVELERTAMKTFRILNIPPMVSSINFHGFFRHHTYPTFMKLVHCKRFTITVSDKADCFAVYQHVKFVGERVFVYSTRCPFDKSHSGPRTVAPYFVGYLEIGHKILGEIVADVAITAWGDSKVLLAVLGTDHKVTIASFNIPKTRLAPENGQQDWNDRSVRAAPTAFTMFNPKEECERIKFAKDSSLLMFSKGTITVHNYHSQERYADGEKRQMVYRFPNYSGHKTTASSFDRENALSYVISVDVGINSLISNLEQLVSMQSLMSVAHDNALFPLPGCYRPVLLAGDLTRSAIVTTMDPPAVKVMRSSLFWYTQTQPRLETRVYDWQLRIPPYARGNGIGADSVNCYAGAWLRRDGRAYDSTEIIIAVAFWNGEVWIFGAEGGIVKGYDPLFVEDGQEWRGIMEPGREYLNHLNQEARLISEPYTDPLRRQASTGSRSFSGETQAPLLSNPAAADSGFSDCPRLLQGRLLVKLKSTPLSMNFETPQISNIDFKQYGRTGLVINTSDRTVERYYFPGFGGETEYHGEVWNENWNMSTVPDEKDNDFYHSVNGIYRKGRDQVTGVQVIGNNWII